MKELTLPQKTCMCIGGFLSGASEYLWYESIRSVQQGDTNYLAWDQSSSIYNVVSGIFASLQAVKLVDIDYWKRFYIAKAISYPIPFTLQLLRHYVSKEKHPLISRALYFSREHLNLVIIAADLSFASIFSYYVFVPYGVVLVAGWSLNYSITLLRKHDLISAKVQEMWEKCFIAIAMVQMFGSFAAFDVPLPLVAIFVSSFAIAIFDHFYDASPSRPLSAHLSLQGMKRVKDHANELRVNWSHVDYDPKKLLPGRDINITGSIGLLLEKVVWTEDFYRKIRGMLMDKSRFIANHPTISQVGDISNEMAKEEFEKCAHIVGEVIASKSFAEGNHFLRYPILQSMLKAVLQSLEANFDERDFLQLVIEGGDLCPAGVIEQVEELYKRRVLRNDDCVLALKFLDRMEAMRERWFEGVYSWVVEWLGKWPSGVVDSSDPHFRNNILFYYHKCCKLHSEAIHNDSGLEGDPLLRFILDKVLNYTFWIYALRSPKWYNADAIVKEVIEYGDISGISDDRIAAWWRQWAEEQKEEALLEELQGGTIFGRSLRGSAKDPEILKLMLCQEGILKI